MSKQALRHKAAIGGFMIAALFIGCSFGPKGYESPAPTATATPAATATPEATAIPRVLAYYTGDAASLESLENYATYLTDVSCDLYAIIDNGSLDGPDLTSNVISDVISIDNAHGIKTWACVSNFGSNGFDGDIAHAAFADHCSATIAAMADLAKSGGFEGINLDFESVHSGDRAALSNFVSLLASALHGEGKKLIISMPAKTRDNPDDDWCYAFDYQALGDKADLLQVMTYDEHETSCEPGPVSGLDWVSECLSFAKSSVSSAKILSGLPAYGYDWDTTDGSKSSMKPWTECAALAAGSSPAWDSASSSPHFSYTDVSGDKHEVWYENGASIRDKAALTASCGLAGLSVWCLGDEDSSFWAAIASGLE